ncbi:MAG: TlpA family protein disulfide reductase [Burkholderiales bacterium]
MSELERASHPAPQRPEWTTARIAWAVVGALGLAASGVGAWYSMRTADESKPVPQGAFEFRPHAKPRPVPELAFEDGQGRHRALGDFRGKTVLLNVWATWCVPCREEMPALDRLQQKLGGPNFEVLALSIDSGGAAAVKRFYDEIGIRALAIYVDPALRAMGSLAVVGIPTTLLLDRQGRELGRHTGPAQWDGPEAMRMIEGHLKRAKP